MRAVVSARLTQLLFSWVFLRTTRVAGALVNRTIDDQSGDTSTASAPSYAPDGKWAGGDQCMTCNIQPGLVDVSQAYNHTWHDSTYHPGEPDRTITFTFTGNAVYVYHLIANNLTAISGTITFTNLTFYIDGQYVDQFVRPPENVTDMLYNVLVFHQINLPHQTHSFKSVTNGPTAALILFDYAIYTTDDGTTTSSVSADPISRPATMSTTISPVSHDRTSGDTTMSTTSVSDNRTSDGAATLMSTTISSVSTEHTFDTATSTTASATQMSSNSSSTTPVGAIVGGTVGGVAMFAAVGILVLCLRRRRTNRPPSIAEKVEPFDIGGDECTVEDLPSRRLSHHPKFPNCRLPPGPRSSVTGSSTSSAGSSRPLFAPHRPHLPSLPRQSVSARTDRSLANTELIRRIRTLEAQMRTLETQQQLAGSSSGNSRGTSRGNPSNDNSGSTRGRSTNRSATNLSLRTELGGLRNEIAELRAEFEHNQQLLAEVDTLPSYSR